MRISDWSSDVCSSDLEIERIGGFQHGHVSPLPQAGGEAWSLKFLRQPLDVVVKDLVVFAVIDRAIDQMDAGRVAAMRQNLCQMHTAFHSVTTRTITPGIFDEIRVDKRGRKSTRLNSSH